MKYLFFFCFFSASYTVSAQQHNVIIITTDGFRWQEVFMGADSALISDTSLVGDTALIKQQYWRKDPEDRRRLLLPFFWTIIASNGRLSGNRSYGNDVNVSNLFKISYAGYNEILTGYADKAFIPNLSIRNKNLNVLDYLNRQPGYAGKVAAFSSWDVMPFIINEKDSRIPVNSGYELLEEDDGDSMNIMINKVQANVKSKKHTRYDLLTYASAKNYMEQHHPRIVFLGLGETDEFAHQGRYDQYLQKAHEVDRMIAELWYYIQTDTFYKNNTTLIITTDHGRGNKTATWNKHGFWVKGSGETWLAMLGPGIAAKGEEKQKEQLYQKQIASTIALLAGEKFIADHPVSAPLKMIPVTMPVVATTGLLK